MNRERRLRSLSEKGLELFVEQCNDYKSTLDKAWFDVEGCLMKVTETPLELSQLRRLEQELLSCCDDYQKIYNNYEFFLERTNTVESRQENIEQVKNFEKCEKILKDVLNQLKDMKLEAATNITVRSKSVRTSKTSSSHGSSVLEQKRIKAELQRTRLKFIEKEAELIRQKAGIEADLTLLKHQSETAVAEAEVKALEESELGSRNVSPVPTIVSETADRVKMTAQYVNDIARFSNHGAIPGVNDNFVDSKSDNTFHIPLPSRAMKFEPTPQNTVHDKNLNPCALVFNPVNVTKQNTSARGQNQNDMTDLTRFLLKKDLLLSRFTSFNDQPESFGIWRASFKSIVNELNVTPFEEMDLLAKWLGPDSSKFALSIRASNINNPELGLNRIWERLEERYGRPEMVESALKLKLINFPKLTGRDHKKLYELLDILTEIECCKSNVKYATLLSYYDSSTGVLPIVNKLPYGIQEKWTSQASRYKLRENVSFPPFSFFVNFIREISTIKNDPAFMYESNIEKKRDKYAGNVFSRKTALDINSSNVSNGANFKSSIVGPQGPPQSPLLCPIHNTHHSLIACRAFKTKSLEQRKKYLSDNKLCFRCCVSKDHMSRRCRVPVKCDKCGSTQHLSLMHVPVTDNSGVSSDGGERTPSDEIPVNTLCTTLCGKGFTGRSCGKVVLVDVFSNEQPEKSVRVYAILDDQSNRSLVSSQLLDQLRVKSEAVQYTLSSCAGSTVRSGRRASGLTVQSFDGTNDLELPTLIECSDIPNEGSEIPTPDVAKCYSHMNEISDKIPPLDMSSRIHLLIGRDQPEAHHVFEQLVGPKGTPFAQRLKLGWVIVGEVCLGKVHTPDVVNVNKTNIINDGRGTIFEPCKNNLWLKEHICETVGCAPPSLDYSGDHIFRKCKEDDKVGLSVEDRKFLKLMDSEFKKNDEGYWTAPLPFKTADTKLPNNRSLALKRAHLLDSSLQKDVVKRGHFVTFMRKVLDSGAAEVAPPIADKDCWYLPLFGVYHPKKRDQIRGVFDSSAVFQETSLNKVLMSGPDFTNNLLGILLRFRMDEIAVTADIEQMFYKFYVDEPHRDYLRFFWYRNNNPDDELIEYRMRVHVFGNSPSPAVASYGLRKAASVSEKEFGSDITKFVTRNFYVDDGLISVPTCEHAIDLMRRTQTALKKEGNIRLHKIASNSERVMSAFSPEDLGKDLKDLCLGVESLPIQHSLGISWDLNSDRFVFDIQFSDKPYTRRGLLSSINSIFDPLGMLAPATISGKILLRELSPPGTNWDEPLPITHQEKWIQWCNSLQSVNELKIPRMFVPVSLSLASNLELHIFSDASEKAIAAAAYIKVFDITGNSYAGFVMGKSKLAPSDGHTIPRLELCGAVLATEIGQIILDNLDIEPSAVRYYTDSKVVLGYIGNETRRFYTYVSNRVNQILKLSSADQWSYVPTHMNPADCGTRFSTASVDLENMWLTGPQWFHRQCKTDTSDEHSELYPLLDPELDKEVRPHVDVARTDVTTVSCLGTKYFEGFSSWKSLVKSISLLQHLSRSFKRNDDDACRGWHLCSDYKTVESFKASERFILREVQWEVFHQEIQCLRDKKRISKTSQIISLSPFLDNDGLLRVGGRLNKVSNCLPLGEVNPIILPKDHHVSKLLVHKYHKSVEHQGRHFTEGALRRNGFWLVGAKRTISSLIKECVTCRKLRGKLMEQKMSDLPEDRLTPGPPFTSVGVDTFGPWQIVSRRTRGGQAHSKRWAILFTCLMTRAVHIEIVEELSSSSFINALRRFESIRGPVKLYRSDRGTNFVGATSELGINTINVNDEQVTNHLYNSGTVWKFNAPHSSHMGGVWERMVGLTRKILDSVLMKCSAKDLTHECLATFMAEVSAILNSRPITPISSDPECPVTLSPSMLLTGKIEHLPVIVEGLSSKDMYRAQWRHVQVLSDLFWKMWREDYLQNLQVRRKWYFENPNLKVGDVVMLREKDVARGDWPLGVIENTMLSSDNKVRKVCVRVYKDGKVTVYTRPISEIVLLID